MSPSRARSLTSLAFYLPQFHRVPENDLWWGEGFTEWTQLRSARPLSRQHRIRRPIEPLGEYCLTDPATLERQWNIASEHSIDGFAVWDYWFGGGKQILQTPIELVLKLKLKFRYCLAWANHSWYDKSRGRLLCEQRYLGPMDYEQYFGRVVQHFRSDNYVTIEGKPVFILFDPHFEGRDAFFDQWEALARQHGFPGIYFVADRVYEDDPVIARLARFANGFRFLTRRNKWFANYAKEALSKRLNISLGPRRFDFLRLIDDAIPVGHPTKFAPTIFTGWDTTPRHGSRGMIFENFDVAAFRSQLDRAALHFRKSDEVNHLLLLKSWNEWAEGNVLEPDSVFGWKLLDAFKGFADMFCARDAEPSDREQLLGTELHRGTDSSR